MKVKGIAIKSLKEYVYEHHPEQLDEWLNALPEASKEIHSEIILPTHLYDVSDAILKPTEVAGVMFFNGDVKKAAHVMAKYGGLKALKSLYRIFVQIASIDFVIKRTTSVFATYYDGGRIANTYKSNKEARFVVHGFSKGEELNINRIAGWIDSIFTVIRKPISRTTDRIIGYDENDLFEAEIIIYWS